MTTSTTAIALGDRIYLADIDSFAYPREALLTEATVTALDGERLELSNGAAVDAGTMCIIEADKGDDGDVWLGTAFTSPEARSEHLERERLWLTLRQLCAVHGYGRAPVSLEALRAASKALDLEGAFALQWAPADADDA